MTYIVLYMYSIALYLSYLVIKIKKNLDLRANIIHFLIYYTKEERKFIFVHFGKSVISWHSHLMSYIIIWLHLFSLEKIQLFIFFT